jgi:large subunit ribosomal protein L32e
MKHNHPAFKRQNQAQKKRIKDAWRKPRGIDNKQRMKLAWAGALPNKGYGTSKKERGLNARKKKECRVENLKQLSKVPQGFEVRIAAGVGEKLRKEIRKKCVELKLKAIN